ncbi:MAG: ATP-binding protein [Paenibacillaceae bacterium]|nr:ATP-binding protein [Paenibacillaceae bacterium]
MDRKEGTDLSDAERAGWSIPGEFGREKPVLAAISGILLRKPGWSGERVEELLTAVSEACLNAMEHGNKLRPGSRVDVAIEATPDSCLVRICDEGAGFEYPPPLAASPVSPRSGIAPVASESGDVSVSSASGDDLVSRGWGLLFISAFADEVRLDRVDGLFCLELRFAPLATNRRLQDGNIVSD